MGRGKSKELPAKAGQAAGELLYGAGLVPLRQGLSDEQIADLCRQFKGPSWAGPLRKARSLERIQPYASDCIYQALAREIDQELIDQGASLLEDQEREAFRHYLALALRREFDSGQSLVPRDRGAFLSQKALYARTAGVWASFCGRSWPENLTGLGQSLVYLGGLDQSEAEGSPLASLIAAQLKTIQSHRQDLGSAGPDFDLVATSICRETAYDALELLALETTLLPLNRRSGEKVLIADIQKSPGSSRKGPYQPGAFALHRLAGTGNLACGRAINRISDWEIVPAGPSSGSGEVPVCSSCFPTGPPATAQKTRSPDFLDSSSTHAVRPQTAVGLDPSLGPEAEASAALILAGDLARSAEGLMPAHGLSKRARKLQALGISEVFSSAILPGHEILGHAPSDIDADAWRKLLERAAYDSLTHPGWRDIQEEMGRDSWASLSFFRSAMRSQIAHHLNCEERAARLRKKQAAKA